MSRRWLVALASLILVAGCDRKPRFVPAGADSTAEVPADSFVVLVERARAGWEGGDPDVGTADLTARLVRDALRTHPQAGPAEAARTFLDSIGFGAEVVGGDVAAVNLFARSDPGGASWPYLFWGRADSATFQSIQGRGMRLIGIAARPAEAGGDAPFVAVVFARIASGGQQPLAFVWRREGRRWTLAQSLGADSLGGFGTVHVEPQGREAVLDARTWQPSPGFTECPTCPHIVRSRRFGWGPDGLHMIDEQVERSPYHAFVQFVRAVGVNDREMAMEFVANSSLIESAQSYGWGESRGQWRVAPGTESDASEIVFFRGNQEAYRVRFASRGGAWRITSLEPTPRNVD